MYTKASIEKVHDVCIVKTFEEYNFDLEKQGSNYFCLSPFKVEKSASCSISPSRQIFKDFSTGKGGNVISFVMMYDNLEYIDAVEKLAKIHHIVLEREKETVEAKRTRLAIQSLEDYSFSVANQFVTNFNELPSDHWAKKLLSERGYTSEILIDFAVGYSLLNNQLTTTSQASNNFENAKKLGLVSTKEAKTYDFFRNRIMFPIHNHKGNVVAFGGRRSNNDNDAKYPKYLNSKESDIYNKSAILYGLWQAKTDIAKIGTAVLTEGYTDVISLHQHQCTNTVATCGTALTEEQLTLLKRYCKHIILLRDGDVAGQDATIKDLRLALKHGFQVDVCELPETEDPDSFARKTENIQQWIDQQKYNAIYWYTDRLFHPDAISRDRFLFERDSLQSVLDTEIKVLQSDLVNIDDIEKQIVDVSEIKCTKEKSSARKNNTEIKQELKEAKKINKKVLEDIEHLKKQFVKDVKAIPKEDVHKKSEALKKIAQALYNVKNEGLRNEYIKVVAKKSGYSPGIVKQEIGIIELQATEKRTKNGTISAKKNLPKGADQQEYNDYGFVTIGNTYHFEDTNGNFFQGTNWQWIPLYHVIGREENKRVVELVNTQNRRRLLDFDSKLLASQMEMKKELYKLPGFRFLAENGFKNDHFEKFVGRYNQQFELAKELLTMGYDKNGFWAFSDGIFYKNEFIKVNKYGIAKLEGVDGEGDEYNEAVENFYLPAFSVMHSKNQEGDDPYENDRNFVRKQSPVTLLEWQESLMSVYNQKAMIGILFIMAACFRDYFIKEYKDFPLLGCFGEKGSGKSNFGEFLQNFFYYGLKALDLSQATHVGFSRRVSRCHNTIVALDEYSDNIDPKLSQGVMGGYGGLGREKGDGPSSKRTKLDKINSALVYMGQWIPQFAEGALADRTIALMFPRPGKGFTEEQKERFNNLNTIVNSGISSLVFDIIQHRDFFEKQIKIEYPQTSRDLKELLKGEEYQERPFSGICKLLATYRVLKHKLSFAFDEEPLVKVCKDLIIANSEQITDSNGVNEFWKIIEFLFERGIISEGWHFKIKEPKNNQIKVKVGKIEKEQTLSEGTEVLYIRTSTVYQFYNKEATLRDGVDVIGESTIMNYLKSRSYFIGAVSQFNFSNGQSTKNTSCFAFNYSMLKHRSIVNLDNLGVSTENDNEDTPSSETKNKPVTQTTLY